MPERPAHPSKPESLDEIVSHSAATIAEQIQAAAAWAKSEMDLQIEVAAALKAFARRAQIKLEGHHNITVATGRPDSVYGSVIVEYKEPHYLSPNKDAAPNKALIEQLKRRFYDFRREENRNWNSMFGVGTDGSYFIFLRFRDEKWTDPEPLPVDRYSTERFLWALYNLGQKGKPYQPEYLHGDFGSDSPVAQEGVRALYEEILSTTHPKAQVFFNQWKILFGEVCGYDVENPSDKLQKLAEFYGVKGEIQPAQLLFALHTYYAILIKLLAAEIVSFFNPWMTRQVERLLNATTSTKLRRELEELERGGIFHQMGITNFLEGDLFSWYLDVWSDPIERLTRTMIGKLDEYNPGTFSEDPAQSRDLLKKLYQQLFPKSVRHDLGEYYTPDWLAEHVLNELGYVGDPDKRLLDPACGSGTFLVMAINRIRHWFDANREKCAYDEGDLLKKILTNVVGFDLNPLAVMAARTNYLVVIKDLVRHVDHVEIPVYLCDSIMTPSEYSNLFIGGSSTVAEVPCSAMKPPHLLVPKEIAQSSQDVAKYAAILEDCLRNGYKSDEFLGRCREEGLQINATASHIDLYNELVRLDKENKNGVWARIIKNNFAPLFVGRVDYVAGNPPWIFWNHLPDIYREQVRTLMTDKYRIAAGKQSTMARLGAAGKDLSMLFVYVAADRFLSEGGRLGYVITQTIFQTGAGDEFRRFMLPDNTPFQVDKVEDWVAIQPFRKSAGNKTAVLIMTKGRPTIYPVNYPVYTPVEDFDREDAPLAEVLRKVRRKNARAILSSPDRPNSFWRIIDENESAVATTIRAIADGERFSARKGIDTNLESAFRVSVLSQVAAAEVLIRNVIRNAKKPVQEIESSVEPDLLFPFVNGRSIKRWGYEIAGIYIVPHTAETGMVPISEAEMKRRYRLTYAFLKHFEEELSARPLHRRWGSGPSPHPFYSVYNIGPYTFAPYRIAWKRSTKNFAATVLSTCKAPMLSERLVLANADAMVIEFSSEQKAHFVCGLLNSEFARHRIDRSITTKAHRDIISVVTLPRFDEKRGEHSDVAALSRDLHRAAAGGRAEVERLEQKLDRIARGILERMER
jgi:hypothetical protein